MLVFLLRKLTVLLILISGMILLLTGCRSDDQFRGTVLGDALPTTDFTLSDQHGNPFTLSEHKGKVVLMFFGFTYCPDVCPLTLSTWKKVQDALQKQTDQVEFVYITVDPDRDSPEKLREHLAIFSPHFIGLTGTQEELIKVYDAYGIYREKVKISDSAAGYLINHTARMYIFDRNGRWRLSFSHDAPVEDIVHDIKILLNETEHTS